MVAAAVALGAIDPTDAQLTTAQSASILFFPLIAADGTEDTLVEIANASNNFVGAHCIYAGTTAGALQTTDFFITLRRQQPTQWVASTGRPFDPTDARCSPSSSSCPGAGLDPGGLSQGVDFPNDDPVPPAGPGFRGALVCVSVAQDGVPIGFNNMLGQATITGGSTGEAFAYTAIGSVATEFFGSNGNTLTLGDIEALQAEATGCPQSFFLNHLAENSEDTLLGSGSTVSTRLAALACSLDFDAGQAPDVTLDLEIVTDLEQVFSTSTLVEGRLETSLIEIDPIFDVAALGSSVARTRITASPGGAAIIGTEARSDASRSGRAGMLLHRDNEQRDDVIVLPAP